MIAFVSNATSYTWSATGGLNIISGQGSTSITVSAPPGFTTGMVKVYASNCINPSGTRSKAINGLPVKPIWKGNNVTLGACGGQQLEYEIEKVSGATSYFWSGPSGAILSDGLGNIGNAITISGLNSKGIYGVSVTFPSGFISGDISVYATNGCGNSVIAALHVLSVPSQPVLLTGNLSVCKSQTNLAYTLVNVPGVTSYSWSIIGGATITGSSSTNPIKVNYPSALSNLANIMVSANNACGSSTPYSFNVNVNLACRTIGNSNDQIITEFDAYPNPVIDNVTINTNGIIVKEEDIKIYDIIGNSLPVQVVNITAYNGIEINLSGFTKGIYMVRINFEDGYKILQIVKE